LQHYGLTVLNSDNGRFQERASAFGMTTIGAVADRQLLLSIKSIGMTETGAIADQPLLLSIRSVRMTASGWKVACPLLT
jgi:hypothetical protein